MTTLELFIIICTFIIGWLTCKMVKCTFKSKIESCGRYTNMDDCDDYPNCNDCPYKTDRI